MPSPSTVRAPAAVGCHEQRRAQRVVHQIDEICSPRAGRGAADSTSHGTSTPMPTFDRIDHDVGGADVRGDPTHPRPRASMPPRTCAHVRLTTVMWSAPARARAHRSPSGRHHRRRSRRPEHRQHPPPRQRATPRNLRHRCWTGEPIVGRNSRCWRSAVHSGGIETVDGAGDLALVRHRHRQPGDAERADGVERAAVRRRHDLERDERPVRHRRVERRVVDHR